MADVAPFWRIQWDGDTYEWFGLSSLTSGRLRAFKQYYGVEYGKANAFNALFLGGDVDAVACVI